MGERHSDPEARPSNTLAVVMAVQQRRLGGAVRAALLLHAPRHCCPLWCLHLDLREWGLRRSSWETTWHAHHTLPIPYSPGMQMRQ